MVCTTKRGTDATIHTLLVPTDDPKLLYLPHKTAASHTPKMISSTALRMAARRAASSRSAAVRFSSTFQQQANSNSQRNTALVATTAGLVAAVAAMQQQETNKTQNFWKSAKTAAKETEEKFGTYWPRNIMILL